MIRPSLFSQLVTDGSQRARRLLLFVFSSAACAIPSGVFVVNENTTAVDAAADPAATFRIEDRHSRRDGDSFCGTTFFESNNVDGDSSCG